MAGPISCADSLVVSAGKHHSAVRGVPAAIRATVLLLIVAFLNKLPAQLSLILVIYAMRCNSVLLADLSTSFFS